MARLIILLPCAMLVLGGCSPQHPDFPIPPREATVDLFRVQICGEESMALSGGAEESTVLRQAVKEYFVDRGFRIVDSSRCPDYDASRAELGWLADRKDVDMYVLLRATAKPYDKFGQFYSFEAEGRGKVAQVSDQEILATTSAAVRGKRELRETVAAESALAACGQELAGKLADVIMNKTTQGALLRWLRVTGLQTTVQVDEVRAGLMNKPGIQSVLLRGWNETTDTALFWVRINAGVQDSLSAYVEQLPGIPLIVQRVDNTGVEARRRGLLE